MSQPKKTTYSNTFTIGFMVVLSFVCAFILSLLASALSVPKEDARELDRSRQMLLAARIYNGAGYFQIEKDDEYVPAQALPDGKLVPTEEKIAPSAQDVLAVYRARIKPMLVDDEGNLTTFAEAKIDEDEYVAKNKKKGYGHLPLKLIYEIMPNVGEEGPPIGYVIPVSGFGLWDYIYGYIAVAPDGVHVIGISWYEHKETPGLGANIAEADWQSQFPGKSIFQGDATGAIDVEESSLGVIVVRGKVKNVLGTGPKANNAVDGMSGATLTGNGVMRAYQDTLTPYRPFFVQLNKT